MSVEQVEAVGFSIIRLLKEMAQEGVKPTAGVAGLENGSPFALRGFPDLLAKQKCYDFNATTDGWEAPITQELACRLKSISHPQLESCTPEACYPRYATQRFEIEHPNHPLGKNSNRCDIRIEFKHGYSLWLECKPVFAYELKKGDSHPFGRDYDDSLRARRKSATNSIEWARWDIRKLNYLNRADATYLGLLLLGFDKTDEFELRRDHPNFKSLLQEMGDGSWTSIHDSWPDEYHVRREKGFREHCWFLYRPVAAGSAP